MADFSSLNGVSSAAYTDYSVTNKYSNDVQSKVSSVSEDSTDEELMEACKEFESYFLEQVFKSMEKTVDAFKNDDNEKSSALSMTSSNSLVDYFKDLTLQDVASSSVETNSNGLAQMLYENMKMNYGSAASSITQSETESN